MNDLIEKFIDNQIWIYINRNDRKLVKDLQNMMPQVCFGSGDKLDSKVMDAALLSGEAWFRHEKGVSYVKTHPRGNPCRKLSPQIYDHGEIVDIKDFINSTTSEIEFYQEDLMKIFE